MERGPDREGEAAPRKGLQARIFTIAIMAAAMVAIIVALGSQGTKQIPTAMAQSDDNATMSEEADAADSAEDTGSSLYTIPEADGTCAECHTSADMLDATKSSDEIDVSAYVVEPGFFLDENHGQISCTTCHGGDATATDAATAHDGMITDPSDEEMGGTCGTSGCHDDIADTFETSMHHTLDGIYGRVCTRMSKQEDPQQTTDDLFDASCSSCHGTCGQCHISSPTAYEGGLLEGHVFTRNNTMETNEKTCCLCHDNIGPTYPESNIHHDLGMNCTTCHKMTEFHGGSDDADAEKYTDLVKANCLECHSDVIGEGVMTEEHLEKVDCVACHTQEYTSCYNCHNGDCDVEEGIWIAKGDDGKLTTVMHMPMGDDMYTDTYGVEVDGDLLDTSSSWSEFNNHSITSVTATQDLCDRCHGEGTALLTEDDLQYPEYEEEILVDPLPAVTAPDAS